jgi:PAS domain S-box-containing protein
MAEPTSTAQEVTDTLRMLWGRSATPVCHLDGDYNLLAWNPAFDAVTHRHWQLAADTLMGRSLLTSLPLPAPLLLALAGLKVKREPERLVRLSLSADDGYWDVSLMPYPATEALDGVLMSFEERTEEVRRERQAVHQRELLAAMLAGSPEAHMWVTADGRVRLENEPAVRLFGPAPVGVAVPLAGLQAGCSWLDSHGEPLAQGLAPFQAAVAGRAIAPTIVSLRRPDRIDVPLRIAVTPVLSFGAGPSAALVSMLDLTRVPGGTLEAPVSEASITDGVLEAIPSALYFLDTTARVRLVNRYMLEFLGLSSAQVLGRPVREVFTLPEELDQGIQDALHTGKAVHRPYIAYDDPRTHSTSYWDMVITPVKDAQDRLQGLVVVSSDVTWRVELTQALSDKVHQLAAIVGHIADGVLVATPDGELLMVNEAAQRLLRLPPHSRIDTLEQFDLRTLDGTRISAKEMPISRVLRGERLDEVVVKVVGDDGQTLVIATSGGPIAEAEERVLMGVLVFHDVTEEFRLRHALTEKVRELEAAVTSLREIDRLKTNFLNTISHELRTPLTNIIGYVELVEDRVLGPLSPPQAETIDRVMESARHLLTLINDLLDFTQLEAGKIDFSFAPVDLEALVMQVVPAVRTKTDKAHPVDIDTAPDTPRVRADHTRLMQVLENLLDNAFKFTPEGGHIRVAIAPEGDGAVRVAITDTGIGIAPDAQEQLFSKFYQVESGLRREAGGTGLGLAICKLLIEKQGGVIGLASEPNAGTTVWFTLPAWRDGEPLPAGL